MPSLWDVVRQHRSEEFLEASAGLGSMCSIMNHWVGAGDGVEVDRQEETGKNSLCGIKSGMTFLEEEGWIY